MSVVVWDKTNVVVDRLAICNGAKSAVDKARVSKCGRFVIAWTGIHECGILLADWFDDGGDVAKWPDFQKTDDWTRMLLIGRTEVFEFERRPAKVPVLNNERGARGAGADFATGALSAGATAIQAAEIVNENSSHCGNGINIFLRSDLLPIARVRSEMGLREGE